MSLLRKIRLYANRCPHCGSLMRLCTWEDSPVPVPALTHVRICPNKHYMDAEHLSSRKIQCWEEGGRALAALADVLEFPDPTGRGTPIHSNLNVPLRKPIPAARSVPAAQSAPPVADPGIPSPVPKAAVAPESFTPEPAGE